MSKYTITLGQILTNLMLKNQYPSALDLINVSPYDYDTDPYKVVEDSRTLFFDNDFIYDIYKPADNKERLEKKLLTHYYNYEICVDMPLHFKFLFKNTLNEIMPFYNNLYKVIETEFDPLNSIDYTEGVAGGGSNEAWNTSKNELDSTTTDDYESDIEDKNKQSDTPQGELDDLYDDKYVSQAQHNSSHQENFKTNIIDSENNLSQHTSGNYTNNSSRTIKGINGISKSKLLLDYKKAIQNVDLQIINDKEVKDLFMKIF